MKRIQSHLGLARYMRISNVWLVQGRLGERFLIDSGHPVERPALRYHLWRAGVRGPGDLTAMILTHRHSDHAGNAAWVRRHFDCPVVCHASDAAVLTGAEEAPPLASPHTPLWSRVLCHLEDRFPARVTIDDVLTDGDARWGFRVFHAPGHTEGSMLLHHEGTQTLFSGDAIIGGLPLRGIERLRLSLDDFSEDGARARASARAVIEALPPIDILCSGHGPAVTRGVSRKLNRLMRRDALWPSLRL